MDLFDFPITNKSFNDYCKTDVGKRAVKYDSENPHVYDLFLKYARQVKNSGRDSYSAQAIFERIRWHVNIETRGDDFKINNTYRAYYARKAMHEHKDLREFFKVRCSGT